MKHPGALISYELKGGLDAGKKIHRPFTNVCAGCLSLTGTVDTLISSHPASMTRIMGCHESEETYQIWYYRRIAIRMSVGIENIQDILNDLGQALEGL